MATRRRREPDTEVIEEPRELRRLEDETTEEPPPQMPEDRIAALLQDVGGDPRAQVRITRLNARTGEREFCGRLTPTEFENGDLDLIRETWGAGKYEIALYGTLASTGFSGKRGMTVVHIAESVRPSPAVNPAQRGEGDMALVLKAIMEGQQQQTAALMAMANKPAPDMMATMMGALPMIIQLKELFGAGKATPMVETLEALKMLREHAGELSGEGGGRSDLAEMVSVGKPLLEMVQSVLAQRVQQAPPHIAYAPVTVPPRLANPAPLPRGVEPVADARKPSPFVNTTPAATGEPESDVKLAEQIRFKVLLSKVSALAAAHTPEKPTIEEAAHLLYDKLPDDFLDLLQDDDLWLPSLELMLQPFGAEHLLTTHAEWLVMVREAVVALDVMDVEEEGGAAPVPPSV